MSNSWGWRLRARREYALTLAPMESADWVWMKMTGFTIHVTKARRREGPSISN
jgi:hypothetical protein